MHAFTGAQIADYDARVKAARVGLHA